MATKYDIYSFPDGLNILSFSSLETFGLNYDIQWDSVNVYGRQDAIQSYKATGQTLNFSFGYSPNTGNSESMGLKDFIKTLNKLTRPIYKGGIIETSPLLVLDFRTLENSFYTAERLIFAPTSVGLDYGDKARLISRSIQGASNPNNTPDILGSAVQPNKIIVSFGGPIIHVGQQYYTREQANAGVTQSTADAAANGAPQKAATENVLKNGGK